MKKAILSFLFVLGTGTTIMNANTSILLFGDCTSEAWDYGTWAGEGDPMLEYLYTNQYFEMHCNEDGSFKNGTEPVISEAN